MEFSKLISGSSLKDIIVSEEFDVKGLAYDSRKIEEGFVFFAIKGYKDDGNKYVKDVLGKGANAVFSNDADSPYLQGLTEEEGNRVYFYDGDIRQLMAEMSCTYYGNPSEKLKLIGVTGTNGKTTITYLLKECLEKAGYTTGLIGTISYSIGDKGKDALLTTPDSIDINRMLRQMVDNGVEYCLMEVSSIALILKRVYGLKFQEGIFTNLTSEHLDLHKTMKSYFEAKKILFDILPEGSFAISNKDDIYGENILKDTVAEKIYYGVDSVDADVKAENIILKMDGCEFDLVTPYGKKRVETTLTGRFNVYNILAVVAGLRVLKVDEEIIFDTLKNFPGVPGRFTRVELPNGAFAVIDYSHTSDSLRNAVEAGREIVNEQKEGGRVITIFGCGGDKDKTKRPVMGKYATTLSDYTIITSDNPRNEEPIEIIEEILTGVEGDEYEVEGNRETAIKRGIEISKSGDLILICGKGHEAYQEVKGIRTHFDDVEMVRKYSELAQ